MNSLNLMFKKLPIIALATLMSLSVANVYANNLVSTIKKVKPAIVGIGTINPITSPNTRVMGTGFSVHDGLHIVTNHHVIPAQFEEKEELVVFIGNGKNPQVRKATVIKKSALYDLAVLKIAGRPLKTFQLAAENMVEEGTEIAFTGFPIGAVLGLYPATHKGIVSSHTPIATPVDNSKLLEVTHIKRLRDPFLVYQLDATAYPGNSGSPIYDRSNGRVYGILNQVFVKESKESVLDKPSGISYAIPVKYLHKMLREIKASK